MYGDDLHCPPLVSGILSVSSTIICLRQLYHRSSLPMPARKRSASHTSTEGTKGSRKRRETAAKARPTARRVRPRRGILEQLLGLPVDILDEVRVHRHTRYHCQQTLRADLGLF